MIPAIARLAFVLVGFAIAAWLVPASVHIVSWPRSGPQRVALLPSGQRLGIVLALAGVCLASVAWSRVFRREDVRRLMATLSPFALLWLWVIPYLPMVPDRAPVLLALAGPLRWGIAALSLFGAAWALIASRGWHWRPAHVPGRRVVFIASFAVYLTFGLWAAAAVGPGGDEPHYLTIVQSLLADHDLQIENNHARGDYRAYFEAPLRPDYLRRGANGAIYSIHSPGLPALLVPAFAAAGYRGAVVFMCLLGALGAVAIFDLAEMLGGAGAAWITVVAVCLSVPIVPHSWMIYPEIAGALIVAWAARWLYEPMVPGPAEAGHHVRGRWPTWAIRGAALSALPWLHTKFSVLTGLLAVALLVRLWPRRQAIVAFAAPIAGSTALWLYSFYWIYGTFDPQAPYGATAQTQMMLANVPRGVLGLLFGQKFGLLPYSPIYLLAPIGLWAALRGAAWRVPAVATIAICAAFVASTTRFYMWWGGSSAPARFLVPIVPLIAPLITIGWREMRSPLARAAATLLLIVGVSIAITSALWPQRLMLFSDPHGRARLLEALQGPSPLGWSLPSFTEEDTRVPLRLLGGWLASSAAALLVVVLIRRRERARAGWGAAAAGIVTFVFAAAAAAESPNAEARRATAERGRLELMGAYDPDRLSSFDYQRAVRITPPELLAMTSISVSRQRGDLSGDPKRLAGPFVLPAGQYVARVTFAGRARHGEAFVALHNEARIAAADAMSANPLELSFRLPVEAPVYCGVSEEQLGNAVEQIDLVADAIVARHARPGIIARALEPIDGIPGSYIVYADRNTYPEGGVFWTRGTSLGTVLVAPERATILVLTLHVGPIGGRLRLHVGGQDRSVDLAPDETRTIEIPLPGTRWLIPITVAAAGEFRPRDHEPGSNDTRWLGAQVRIGLR